MKVKVKRVKKPTLAFKCGDVVSYQSKQYTVVGVNSAIVSAVERVSDDFKVSDLKEPIHLDFIMIPMNQVAVSVQTRIRPELKYESEPAADLEPTPEPAADLESTSEEVPEQ